MEDDQVAALAASFGKAMADALAANEGAREERAAEAQRARANAREAEYLAEKRIRALRRVADSYESQQKRRADSAERVVRDYCREAHALAIEPLKKDPRMPRSINYLERYQALVGMDDRNLALQRVASTIDRADEILESAEEVTTAGVKDALGEAAGAYAQRVSRLNGIRVAAAERLEEADDLGGGFSDELEQSHAARAEGLSEISQTVEDAFLDALGELPEAEVRAIGESQDKWARETAANDQVEAAEAAAEQAVRALMKRLADTVAGTEFAIGELGEFAGTVGVEKNADVSQVRELSAEVRKSFGTFKRVVADNGLFAAFSNDSAYGTCNGTSPDSWWYDIFGSQYFGEKPGRDSYDDIPTGVEEDEGGDSLVRSIERMREFNKQQYWGMLDDDFSGHVDAFWYGFKKLMENVNGLFKLDVRDFNAYCGKVSRAVQDAARKLGLRMDDSQAKDFRKQVEKQAKK